MGKIRGGESLTEVPKILHYGFRDWGCSRCNITTVRYEKKARRTDWSGRERTSESKRFGRLYIAIETNIQIKKQTVGQIFIGIITRTCG